MGFLPRLLVVIGLSVVFTLLLMVIHWEPEDRVQPSEASIDSPTRPASRLVSGIR